MTYSVLESGDGLTTSSFWNGQADPASDWAILQLQPALSFAAVAQAFSEVGLSGTAPAVGESVVAVGYTVSDGRYKRHYAPATVMACPDDRYRKFGEEVVWLRGIEPSTLATDHTVSVVGSLSGPRPGLSGSPVLRKRADGSMEVCAVLIGGERQADAAYSGVGVAIAVPLARIEKVLERPTPPN